MGNVLSLVGSLSPSFPESCSLMEQACAEWFVFILTGPPSGEEVSYDICCARKDNELIWQGGDFPTPSAQSIHCGF